MNRNRDFITLRNDIQTEMQLDPGLISDEERKRFINDAISDLGEIGLFEKGTTLTVTDGKATLPDDLVLPIVVKWVSDGRVLKPFSTTTPSFIGSNPLGFVILYNEIEVIPKADGDLFLYYSYRPQPLVDDADQPDIPNGWDWLIVDYAVARAHRKNGNIGLWREYMANYENGKFRLTQELTKRINTRIVETHNQDEIIPEAFSRFIP